MHTFKDNSDRVWTLSINVNAVKRCRALVSVDLYGLITDGFKGLGELLGDPPKFVDVLYVLCMDEANKRDVSDDVFGQSMGGDTLELAADAFTDELINFSPPRLRPGLKKVVAASKALTERMTAILEERIDQLDLASIADRLTGSSGNSPASSESTQDRSPSENST